MKVKNWFTVCLVILFSAVVACGGGETAESGAGNEGNVVQAPVVEEAAGSPPAVVVGLITDLSGRFVTFGKDIELATNLAVQAVNDSGGINGSPLEVKVIDTGGEPDQAVVGLRQLVDQGVFAVSGPLSSGEAEVVFAQAAQLDIPIVTGTANKEGITELGEGWAFRNTATNTALYTVAMPAWAEKYGITTAVLVYDEAEPVSSAAAKFSIPAAATAVGITIVNGDAPITFAHGQTDFSTTVQRIKDTEADGLIIMSGPAEAGLLVRELVRQGETRPVIGHPAQNSNTFFEQGGTDVNNWVLPSIFNPNSTDTAVVNYKEAMAAADKEPPTVPEAANYYDTIMLLAQVMRDAGIDGNSSPAEARTAIQQGLLKLTDFQGLSGLISFNGSSDANKTIYVNVVNKGQLEPLH